MKKVNVFVKNGRYEQIWWYWQSKKSVPTYEKKIQVQCHVKIKERGTKDKRVGYSETKAGQPKQEHGGDARRLRTTPM